MCAKGEGKVRREIETWRIWLVAERLVIFFDACRLLVILEDKNYKLKISKNLLVYQSIGKISDWPCFSHGIEQGL